MMWSVSKFILALVALAVLCWINVAWLLDCTTPGVGTTITLLNLSTLQIIGIGLGLPLLITGVLFSWVQFYLLATGEITPHMSEMNFTTTLNLIIKALTH